MSDVCNVTYAVDFVKTNLSDAATVAQQLQVSTEFILGLSAAESGWGRDWNATKVVNGQPARNFFSLQGDASSPFANGSMKSGGGTSLSTFASYLDSAKSFAAQYGTLVKGKATAKEFATALVPRFNPGKAPLGNPTFIQDLVSIIGTTKARMGCK
jgi:flagellum-specific peptidoglycan hydrolase FlgJ